MTTPQPSPASRNKLLIIIGAAVVVLLAIIAVSVSSQAIRAGQETDAKASAAAGEKALADQKAADAEDANHVCEQQVLKKHPTAAFEAGRTRSTFQASDSSYETVGFYTDDALYGNSIPMQFVCSSTKGSGTNWNVSLTALGRQ